MLRYHQAIKPIMESENKTARDRKMVLLFAAINLICLIFMASQLILLTGHDYGLALTRLLDTHFAMISHGLSLFEYSPSFCGGIFNFANPNSGSLSLTQLLVYIAGPEIGIKALYVIASAIGGVGMFWCGRQSALSTSAALIAASCFTLSGVFLVKLVVGHLLYYHLLLTPLIAAFLLRATYHFLSGKLLATVACAGAAAMLTSLSIYGGVAGFLLPFMASVLLLWLMCGGLREQLVRPMALFVFYLGLAVILSAPKIEASLSLFSNIGNRDFYSLPGFGFSGLLSYIASALFLVPDADRINSSMSNATWYMGWHEIYVGLPQLGLVSAAVWVLFRPASLKGLSVGNYGRFGTFGILTLLLLPLALNYYSPSWHGFIKALPVLGDSSNMLRWTCLYVPAFAMGVGQIFRNVDLFAPRPAALVIAMMVVTSWWQYSVISQHLLAKENFDPSGILAQWHSDPEKVLPIKFVGLATNDDGKGGRKVIHAPQFDHMFTKGISNATCYEPVFGYRLEAFPISSIRSGDVTTLQNDTYGLINPACYVYPTQNNCAPGDRFTAAQKAQMISFAERREFEAEVSSSRMAAEMAASVSGIALMFCFGFCMFRWFRPNCQR